ncbi:MAG: hypothetical protein MUQ26_08285, partial [Armatimonadetes bacterium]|nr:hypothetical protein [Armatimonadota bacterium]
MLDLAAALPSAKSACLAALALLAILASTSAGCAGSRPDDLFRVDARGGAVLRFQGMDDLTQPGAPWDGNGSFEMAYEQPEGELACYRLVLEDPKIYSMMAGGGLALKPNRSYIISVLLDSDFERPIEINVGVWTVDDNGKTILMNLNGVPNKTDGWQRWEWEFTADPRFGPGTTSRLYFQPFDFPKDGKFRIADIALVELPPKPLAPYAKGEGVTFRGGPGPLPMRIEEAKSVGDTIEVRTTGARYTFDLRRDTIAAEQLLERERPIAVWRSSLSLEGLEILSTTAKECVLANDNVTFGVQCDSLVMVAPQRELVLTCESKIGGRWNRFIAGHLLVIDDYGGIAVNPDIPLGSGRLARTDVLTDGLDFIGVADDTEFLSSAQPGWEIAWTVSPGERLALSVFPPRPFDWQQSFHMNWCLTFNGLSTDRYPEWSKYLDVVVLWDFCHRGYGMSFGPRFIPYDED